MNDPWTDVLQPDITKLVLPVTMTPSPKDGSGHPLISSITLTGTLPTPEVMRSICSTAAATGTNSSLATSCSLVSENAPTRGAALGVSLGLGIFLIGAIAAIMYKWWRRRKNEQYSKLDTNCEKALQDPGAQQLLSLASPTQPPPSAAATTMANPGNRFALPSIQERSSTDVESDARGQAPVNRQTSNSGIVPSAPTLQMAPFPGRLTMNLSENDSMPTVQTIQKFAVSKSGKSTESYHGSIHSTTTRVSSRTSSPFPSSTFKAYSPTTSKQPSPDPESPVDPLCQPRSMSGPGPGSRSGTHTPIPLLRSKAPTVLLPRMPFKVSPLTMHATQSSTVVPSQGTWPIPTRKFVPYSAIKRAAPLPVDCPSKLTSETEGLVSGLVQPSVADGNGRRGAMSG